MSYDSLFGITIGMDDFHKVVTRFKLINFLVLDLNLFIKGSTLANWVAKKS